LIYLIGLVGFVLSLLTALVMVFFFFLAYYCILYTLFKKIGKYLNYVIIFFGSNPFIYIFESIRHRTWDLTKPWISCCRVSSVWLSRWETDTMYLPFITYKPKMTAYQIITAYQIMSVLTARFIKGNLLQMDLVSRKSTPSSK